MEGLVSYVTRHADDLIEATGEHIALVTVTLACACVLAALICAWCMRSPRRSAWVVEALGAAYSIPSLALFALLIPVSGLGFTTAVIVMVVYCQFMLVRNALAGLNGVDAAIIEAARGMGMDDSQVLLRVRLPLALPEIIAGVRLATVSTIGIATIASTINAGGIGLILFSGLRSLDLDKILAGTLCCVALALVADGAFRLLERALRRGV